MTTTSPEKRCRSSVLAGVKFRKKGTEIRAGEEIFSSLRGEVFSSRPSGGERGRSREGE